MHFKTRRFGRERRLHAFTLVELLAAAVIVVLLIAMVQPSLEAARRASKNDVCLERLGAIGMASRMYEADDPNGWYIPVHPRQFFQDPNNPSFIGAYEWGGKSGIGRPGFSAPGVLGSKYGTRSGFGPASRPLNRLLYANTFRDNLSPTFNSIGATRDTELELDAYRCPADDGPPQGAHCVDWVAFPTRTSFDHFGTSFTANIFWIRTSGGGSIFSNSPYLRPGSRVPDPARTIAYEENIGRWAWACRREACGFLQPGVDPGPTRAVRGWHGRNWVFNQTYSDGHAGTAAVFVEGTEDAEGYYQHYVIEQVFDDPDLQEELRCLIVRGSGWQKDTLPAPTIPTGLAGPGEGRAAYEDCVENGG